ncbi:hypothetical protein KLP40_19030 [Hymenobacter sp. NST-14]|uniref:hypothetical protein n=1 Tax=Hymenobacter piscis TaxID=2839984 RepID=UPI001C039AF7|nr:hypothetical protein [Hymenobacter piscis]MBT9395270.1 hypothetical protein [Hymenobacter piscis]
MRSYLPVVRQPVVNRGRSNSISPEKWQFCPGRPEFFQGEVFGFPCPYRYTDTMTGFQRLLLLLLLLCLRAPAAPAQLLLDVSRFRNENESVKGGVVEVYVTVSGQQLTYQRRGPKLYQAGAVVTLEAIRPDGAAEYQETITLKPPVLRDTTAAIKNPVSFQKRINLPEGRYTLRARMRDQYRAASTALVEQPLVVEFAGTGPMMSDVVLLAKPASRAAVEANNFIRNGLTLARAPAGLYARGQEKLFFYAELYHVPAGQPLVLRYYLRGPQGTPELISGKAVVQGSEGKPTVLAGELDLSKVPAGNYQLMVEVRNPRNQVIASQTTNVRREPAEYAPAGATISR